jgi:hypothetical protein
MGLKIGRFASTAGKILFTRLQRTQAMTTPEQKALKHPEPEQRRACMRCIWWQARNSVIGQCRRMPPSRPEGEAAGFWPMTGRADWCGEYLEGDRA